MVAVIDYNAGNVRSVLYALERIGVEAVLTANHEEIAAAEKVIFPGVGAAGSTMRFLREEDLDQLIADYADGTLQPEQAKRLLELLQGSESVRLQVAAASVTERCSSM